MSWIRPRGLRPGDLVGVCAPSSPFDPERLERGVAGLEAMGFAVRVAPRARERRRFTAGTVEDRLSDLHALFEAEDVRAVVCARGGAGAGWLLPRLDGRLLAGHPKPLVGYSDATFLHLFLQRLPMVSFHGPMVTWELADAAFDGESWSAALTAGAAPYASGPDDLVSLREGAGEGRLLGGCLSVLAAAAGTPWALRPDAEGTILFLEDVDERPYRLDRMLLQLRESGALLGVRGVVFGDMKGCNPPTAADWTLEDVILEALAGLDVPIALGLSSGHASSPNVTLPLGVRARLSAHAGEARFELLESAVS
jgi:muramoyltetrapeptide carboxypeptidase